jgi:hypothetical protein
VSITHHSSQLSSQKNPHGFRWQPVVFAGIYRMYLLLFHLLYAIETKNNDEFPSALTIWHAEKTLINGVEKRLAPLLVSPAK